MRRVSVKGVLLGGIVDIVATNVLSIAPVIYLMSKMDIAHLPKDQVQAAVIRAMHESAPVYFAFLVIGCLCSALGGYVAAWLAKHDELLNGLLSSFLCDAIGLYSIAAGKNSISRSG